MLRALRPAPITTRRGGYGARTCRLPSRPGESRCLASSSDGERHERVRLGKATRFRTVRGRRRLAVILGPLCGYLYSGGTRTFRARAADNVAHTVAAVCT